MPISDLWTSPDSKGPSGGGPNLLPGGIYAPQTPGTFLDQIHRITLSGKLPDALPNQTRQGSAQQAPQYDLGGVARSAGSYNPDDPARLWGGVTPTDSRPFQGANLDPALQAQILAGDRGGILHGVDAFLGSFQPWAMENHGIDGGMQPSAIAGQQWQQLSNLAAGIGIDPRKFSSNTDLYNAVSQATNDYYTVGGLTPWSRDAAKGNPDVAARTLYRANESTGTLDAVTRPILYADTNDDKGFIGKESLMALSMALPAFGGIAGMLGSGVSGTLSAGSGLGLTGGLTSALGSGLSNALINGLSSGILSGSFNPMSMLSGMASGFLGGGNFNPMTSFTQMLGNLGPEGRQMGQGVGAASMLARLFR